MLQNADFKKYEENAFDNSFFHKSVLLRNAAKLKIK